MPSIRLAIFRFLSIPEIIIAWAIEKVLDYALKHVIRRARHFLRSGNFDFGVIVLYLSLVFSFPLIRSNIEEIEKTRNPTSGFVFESFLITHRRIHEWGFKKAREGCTICQYIFNNKPLFEHVNPDPRLYPPYKFIEGEDIARRFAWNSGTLYRLR